MAPPRMNFQSGFLADTADLDATKIDDTLRSFMDKGEAVFEGEEGRSDVISGVRNTILAKLRDANKASADDAEKMEGRHIQYSRDQMTPLILQAKKAKREADIAYAQFLLAKSRSGAADAVAASEEIDKMVQSADSGNAGMNFSQLSDTSGDNGNTSSAGEQTSASTGASQNATATGASTGAEGTVTTTVASTEAEGTVAATDASTEAEGTVTTTDASTGAEGTGGATVASTGAEGTVTTTGASTGAEGTGGATVASTASGANTTTANTTQAPTAATNAPEETAESQEDRTADYNTLTALQKEIRANAARTRSKFVKFITFVGVRRNRTQSKVDKARASAEKLRNEISDRAQKWDDIRKRYRETTFRKHYNTYDTMAESYYSFTRKLEGSDERTIGRVKNELGGGDASKQIAEYTGVYDRNQLEDIKSKVSSSPYSPVPELRRVKNKALGTDSVNTESADKPIKFHRAMVMTAFAEGVRNVTDEAEKKTARVRMKLMSNFRGYRAKRQFADNTNTALTETQDSAESRGKGSMSAASTMNLTADEKGRNGAYLHSESSAKMYSARTQLIGGQTVRGFYHNGQFYSDDYSAMSDQSEASRLRSPNWNSVEKEEKARDAIRRSDFFYHVNSGTIQHYMSYNPDDQFGKEDAQEKLHGATEEKAPESVKSIQLLETYLDPSSDDTAKNAALTDLGFAALNVAETEKKEFGPSLAIMLLAEDDPKLWNIAKEMAERMGGRFAARLKGIPQSGEVMRITLVEEFANAREFDWKDIGSSLRPDRLNMHIEDLSAKRAGFFSLTNLRQSFWDGSIMDVITDSYSAGKDVIKTAGLEGVTYEKIKADFTGDYLDAASAASTNFGIVLAPIPGIVAMSTGGMDEEGNVSEAASTTMNSLTMFQSVVDFVQSIAALVKNIQSIKKAKKKGDPLFPVIMKLIGTVIKLVSNLVSMIAIWLDSPAMKAVTSIVGTVKTVFNTIRSTVDIIRTSFEINQISKADKDVDSALTEYTERKALLQDANMTVNEANMSSMKEKMGMAATNNSQAQYFLALAKNRARRERKMAISGTVTNTINSIGNFIGMGSKLAWFNPVAFPFQLAGKVSQFIGWSIGKIHDASTFNDTLSRTIGMSGISNWGAFDEAVKRETGISSRHYLVDLARIFMAIDTHHMLRSGNKTEGETALSISLMAPYLKMAGDGDNRYDDVLNRSENSNRLKKVKLDKLMGAVGGPDNWRAVLRMSITG